MTLEALSLSTPLFSWYIINEVWFKLQLDMLQEENETLLEKVMPLNLLLRHQSVLFSSRSIDYCSEGDAIVVSNVNMNSQWHLVFGIDNMNIWIWSCCTLLTSDYVPRLGHKMIVVWWRNWLCSHISFGTLLQYVPFSFDLQRRGARKQRQGLDSLRNR